MSFDSALEPQPSPKVVVTVASLAGKAIGMLAVLTLLTLFAGGIGGTR